MNEIITGLCVSMLSGSIVSLFVSLFGTIKAYKKHTKAKKELEIFSWIQSICVCVRVCVCVCV